jgi:predicted outer membrane protein
MLEGRVVLSSAALPIVSVPLPSGLLSSLTHVGVVTSPIPFPSFEKPIPLSAVGGAPWSKLNTDIETLITELQTLAAKSGLTISDRQSLTDDGQAIAQAGFYFDSKALNPVTSELATAVAGGSSTSQAGNDFSALFSGSSVSTTLITTTFSDLAKAIQDSNVTTTDLATVAAGEAVIQADLPVVPPPLVPYADGSSYVSPMVAIAVNPAPVAPVSPLAISVPPIIISPPPGSLPPIVVHPPIVPVPFGAAGLLASLSSAGVVTNPVVACNLAPSSTATPTGPLAQLFGDVQKLQDELQSLAAKSGVTIADLQSLTSDGQAMTQAGFYFDPKTLNPVISELATAVAGGTSTSQAQTDFAALLSGSSVSAPVITSTFNNLVKTIQDSKVTPADLTTVANDQAAIQTDLKSLHPPVIPGQPPIVWRTPGGGSAGSGSTGSSPDAGHRGKKPQHHQTSHVSRARVHNHIALRTRAMRLSAHKL